MTYLNKALKAELFEQGLKICTKCREIKPVDDFYNHRSRLDGKMDWCKVCTRAYQASPEALKSQSKYRKSAKWQECQHQYWQTDAYKESQRRYRQSAKGKKAEAKHNARYRASYPEKAQAKDAAHNAIRAGKLPHFSTRMCECGKQAGCYHHWSYLPEHRLDVIPMCRDCHVAIHSEATDLRT